MRNGIWSWTSSPNAFRSKAFAPAPESCCSHNARSRNQNRAKITTVIGCASFPSRIVSGRPRIAARRAACTHTQSRRFRNRAWNGQVAGIACLRASSRTSHEDPFGNIIRMTGTGIIARDNPFRFSTKRTDDTTDLVLYEYRPYSPSLGRWPSRDPLGEEGSENLYAFVRNEVVAGYDPFGLLSPADHDFPGSNAALCHPPCSRSMFYDLDDSTGLELIGDKLAEPSETKWINNLPGIVEDIRRETREGTCCVKMLTLTAHNGNAGVLPLGTGMVLDEEKLVRLRAAILANESPQKIAVYRQQESSLRQIGNFLCKPATIDFAMCNSGAGTGGALIRSYLQEVFGPNVEIILHEGECKWAFGHLINFKP